MNTSKPACQESLPPVTSRGGPIPIAARICGSSIGPWPSGRVRRQRRNILGQRQRFSEVPFFWSQHYDVPINYVGHAESWDDLDIDGNIESRDCLVRYHRNGKVLAVASIFRDVDNLREEAAMESAG